MLKRKHATVIDGALPSLSELRDIEQSTQQFDSFTFKTELEHLISSRRPKASRKPPLERFLRRLKEAISNSSELGPFHPLQTSLKDVRYPRPEPTGESKWSVSYKRPTDIYLAGSWQSNSAITPDANVDVIVEMPAELFQEKDYRNGRYFHKRAFYLAALYHHLSSLDADVSYEFPANDTRRAVLALLPRQGSSQFDFSRLHVRVRVIPVLAREADVIPLRRLAPQNANMNLAESNAATPIYNNLLLRSVSSFPRHALLSTHTLAQSSPAFCDALVLLKIWARAHGYCTGAIVGFEDTSDLWVAILHLLLLGTKNNKKHRPLGTGLSSYQLLRGALDLLKRTDFGTTRLTVASSDDDLYPEDSHAYPCLVLHGVNVLSSIPLSCLSFLRLDAAATLHIFSSSHPIRAFSAPTKCLQERFDVLLHLSAHSSVSLSEHRILEHGSPDAAFLESCLSLLKEALGDRIEALVAIRSTGDTYIGIRLAEASKALSLITRGPRSTPSSAGNNESPMSESEQTFAKLWGNHELRQFKDGWIGLVVVWDHVVPRSAIPAAIVSHILHRHFAGNARDVCEQLEAHVRQVEVKSPAQAYDTLERALKDLNEEEVPLGIASLSACSPHMRGSGDEKVLEVVLRPHSSGRWPDDLRAIRATKLVLFSVIAPLLPFPATVVVPPSTHSEPSLELMVDGFTFRGVLLHDRTRTLLTRQGKSTLDWDRMFLHSPAHHRAVAAFLHVHPSYIRSVRLASSWFAAHGLLSIHVSIEAVEILVAKVYLDSKTDPPRSAFRAFALLMVFLSSDDLLDCSIPFGEGISSEASIDDSRNSAKEHGQGCWKLKTNLDSSGRLWTSQRPGILAANRVTVIARETLHLLSSSREDPRRAFRTSSDGYDFAIHLNESLSHGELSEDPSVLLAQDIQRVYTGVFEIFYDTRSSSSGTKTIFGSWDPRLRQFRPFRALGHYSSTPAAKGKDVLLNESAVLDEVKRMGDGIVERVVVLKGL